MNGTICPTHNIDNSLCRCRVRFCVDANCRPCPGHPAPSIGCSFDRPELVRLEEDNAALRLEINRLCEAYDRLIKSLRERLLRSDLKIHNARQALEGDIADPPASGFL